MTTRPGRAAYVAWISVCVVWGTTYLAIRVALESIPPALVGGLRFTVAGGLLAIVLWVRGHSLPGPARWPAQLLLGTLLLAVGNGFVVWAEQWVPSGIAAVVIASAPFWMATTEALIPGGERFARRTLMGMGVGFTGILLLVWPDLAAGGTWGRQFLIGMIGLQLAEIGWSLGSSYAKRQARHQNALTDSAFQMLFGGIVMLAVATVRGEWTQLSFTPRTIGAEVYLIVFGSIAGYSAYIYALKHLPLSTVSLYAYVNPIIAVALGSLLLDEPFGARIVLASALVLIGIAIARSQSHQNTDPGSRNAEGPALPRSSAPVHASHDSTAAHQSHQEQHDGDDQQDPDEVPERVAADHPKQPQDDQNDRNRLEHAFVSSARLEGPGHEDGVQHGCRQIDPGSALK